MPQNVKQDTKINIKRTIADTFGTSTGLILSVGAATALSFTLIPPMVDNGYVAPDETGSAIEESILAQHHQNFADLEEVKSQIDMLKAQTSFTGGSTELTELKAEFGRQALSAYKDLYLNGSTAEGAGISEKNFEELRAHFTANIADPAEFGFQKEVKAGMLDETLAETRLRTGSELERFQTVQAVNSTLAELQKNYEEKKDKPYEVAGIISLLSFIVLFGASMAANEKWGYEPKRIPRDKPRKLKHGNH